MPKVKLNVINGFYQDDSKPFSAQRCVNWIPVVAEDEALNSKKLMGRSGISEFCDLDSFFPTRGATVVKEIPYCVNGLGLFRINADSTFDNLGTITGVGRVSIAHSYDKIVIVVPGGDAFVYDTTLATFTQITDPNYVASDTVVFNNGYFIFSASDGTIVFTSPLNDLTPFDPLDRTNSAENSDEIIAVYVSYNNLYIIRADTIQLYQDVGNTNFPYEPVPGGFIQKGVHAKFSLVDFDNTFLFMGGGLGERTAIWKVTSSATVAKISTNAIDEQLQAFTGDEIASAFAFSYAENGNFFAVFTIESNRIDGKTFVYNGTASQLAGHPIWSEMQSGLNGNRWRVNAVVRAYGTLLIGDSLTGKIGQLDNIVYTEFGEAIYYMSVTQPFAQNYDTLFFEQLEVTMETGVGLDGPTIIGDEGKNPVVQLSYSDDGGRNWTYFSPRSFGRIGRYDQRTYWPRLGRTRTQRMFRFEVTDPVKCNLLKAEAVISKGPK